MIRKLNHFRRAALSVFLLLGAGLEAASVKQFNLFVSPDGARDNSGSQESPLAGIADARDLIREKIKDGLSGEVIVWVRGGRY